MKTYSKPNRHLLLQTEFCNSTSPVAEFAEYEAKSKNFRVHDFSSQAVSLHGMICIAQSEKKATFIDMSFTKIYPCKLRNL